jgi:hypothetical protein
MSCVFYCVDHYINTACTKDKAPSECESKCSHFLTDDPSFPDGPSYSECMVECNHPTALALDMSALPITADVLTEGTDGDLCECEPGTQYFCGDSHLNKIYDCGGSQSGLACAKTFADSESGESSCSCLSSCTPPAPLATQCDDDAHTYCWTQSSSGCSDDDDNQFNCVYYCQKYYIGTHCGVNLFSECHKSCSHFMSDEVADGPGYAECMFNCDHGRVYLK